MVWMKVNGMTNNFQKIARKNLTTANNRVYAFVANLNISARGFEIRRNVEPVQS